MDEGIININSSKNKINKVDEASHGNKVNLMPSIFTQLPIWATNEGSCAENDQECDKVSQNKSQD